MKPKILTVGHACLDIVYFVDEIPDSNTKVSGKSVEIRVGGNAANVAVALSEMGTAADLCTVMGSESHPFTRILMALLQQYQIGTSSCVFDECQPCSSSTILVLPDGDRAIVNWQGETIKSAVAMAPKVLDYQMIMADAYRIPLARETFARAKSAGIPTMIDVDGTIDDIGSIPSADHVWFSYESWKKHRTPLRDLQQRFGGVVGITNGGNPVHWIDLDGIIFSQPPNKLNALNTLGAGDVFRARLALGICLGENLTTAVSNSCDMAARQITNQGLIKII